MADAKPAQTGNLSALRCQNWYSVENVMSWERNFRTGSKQLRLLSQQSAQSIDEVDVLQLWETAVN